MDTGACFPLAQRSLQFSHLGWLSTAAPQNISPRSPSVLFLPAVFLSSGFTKRIFHKIPLRLTITVISTQSYRSFHHYFASFLALSFCSLAETLSWPEVPAQLKSASLLSRYRGFIPHKPPYGRNVSAQKTVFNSVSGVGRTGVENVLIQYPRYSSSQSTAQVCVRETDGTEGCVV